MRSSDWSSDVCSSDLAISEIDAHAETSDSGYYRLRAQLLRGQALIDLGQAGRGMPLMEQANAGFLEKGQMVDLLDGLARQVDALEHVGQPTQALAAARRLQALRSEEHTSELQSLMRNSYAVFCLKKKKKHRTSKKTLTE